MWKLKKEPRAKVFYSKWGIVKSQLDWELDAMRVELRTKRNLPIALRKGKKDRELKRAQGSMLVFLIVPKFPDISLVVKKQISTE